MRNRFRSRPGFALAVALAAIVIIGAIITGMFFTTTQEYRISRNSAMQARALTAAEYGMNYIMQSGQWVSSWNTASNGLLATVAYSPGDGSVDTVRVTKLNAGQFLVTSTGRNGVVSGGQAMHRIGGLVTLAIPQINILGALTTRGQAKIGGSSFLSGVDSTIANWSCPPAGAALAGLVVPDTTKVTTAGCGGYSCLDGTPKLQQNPIAAKDSTYFNYGPGLDWATLVAMANKTIGSGTTLNNMAPSAVLGVCNTADPLNWGDPLHLTPAVASCQTYFPIVYAQGNLHMTGGVGQGILLVEGDLQITGGAVFYGPVIVKGSVSTSGTGGHIYGGVMAADVDLSQNSVLGNGVVQYSGCAVSRALAGIATPTFAVGRSWAELY